MLADWVIQECPAVSTVHRETAMMRQGQLTKPTGALGRLETLAIELAGLQHAERPRADRVPIIVFAGDHGIAAQGVSAYPQEVTIAMMANFAGGGAAISVLARELGSPLEVVDAGTLAETPMPDIVTDKPRRGSRDFSKEAALRGRRARLRLRLRQARRGARRGVLARSPDPRRDGHRQHDLGRGDRGGAAWYRRGQDHRRSAPGSMPPAARARRASSMLRSTHHRLEGAPAEHVLATVGGLEIAAICGAIIASAQRRIPVLVDGFIVSVAALAASRVNPSCRPYLIFSHRSAEQGHRLVLEALDARPLLDLDLQARRGLGRGACAADPAARLRAP